MFDCLKRIWRWIVGRWNTLDLLPEYVKAIYQAWHEYLWGALLVAPIIIWWMLPLSASETPPMWLVVGAFFWAFLVAGYYVWRKEHVVAPLFRSWIPDMTVTPAGRLFVGMQIINLGPPTSIQTWQAGFERSDGGHNYLSDRMFVEEDDVIAPANIRGRNLRHDHRLLATGETREGWIAFDIGPQSDSDAARAMRTVSLTFTDAFEHQHEVSTVPSWARKLEK